MENKEMAVVPQNIEGLVAQSGIEQPKAIAYAMPYVPILEAVNTYAVEVKTLDKDKPEDVARAKRIRIELGKLGSQSTEIKKADKASLLVITRYLDALFNTAEGALRLTQSEAKEIEEHAERIEAKRIAALKEVRWVKLSLYMESQPNGFETWPEDVFNAFLSSQEKAHHDKIEAEKEAQRLRDEAVRLDKLEAERRLLIAPFMQFLESAPELRGIDDVEFHALLTTLKNANAAHQKEQEEIKAAKEKAELELESERKKAKEQAEQAEKLRQAELAKAAEIQRQLDAERKQRELEEIAKQEALKAEAESKRKAANAPDKEKLIAYGVAISNIEKPALINTDAIKAFKEFEAALESALVVLRSGVKGL